MHELIYTRTPAGVLTVDSGATWRRDQIEAGLDPNRPFVGSLMEDTRDLRDPEIVGLKYLYERQQQEETNDD